MAAIKPSIKDILCLEKIPLVLEKSYELEAFVMNEAFIQGNVNAFCWGKIGHSDATE